MPLDRLSLKWIEGNTNTTVSVVPDGATFNVDDPTMWTPYSVLSGLASGFCERRAVLNSNFVTAADTTTTWVQDGTTEQQVKDRETIVSNCMNNLARGANINQLFYGNNATMVVPRSADTSNYMFMMDKAICTLITGGTNTFRTDINGGTYGTTSALAFSALASAASATAAVAAQTEPASAILQPSSGGGTTLRAQGGIAFPVEWAKERKWMLDELKFVESTTTGIQTGFCDGGYFNTIQQDWAQGTVSDQESISAFIGETYTDQTWISNRQAMYSAGFTGNNVTTTTFDNNYGDPDRFFSVKPYWSYWDTWITEGSAYISAGALHVAPVDGTNLDSGWYFYKAGNSGFVQNIPYNLTMASYANTQTCSAYVYAGAFSWSDNGKAAYTLWDLSKFEPVTANTTIQLTGVRTQDFYGYYIDSGVTATVEATAEVYAALAAHPTDAPLLDIASGAVVTLTSNALLYACNIQSGGTLTNYGAAQIDTNKYAFRTKRIFKDYIEHENLYDRLADPTSITSTFFTAGTYNVTTVPNAAVMLIENGATVNIQPSTLLFMSGVIVGSGGHCTVDLSNSPISVGHYLGNVIVADGGDLTCVAPLTGDVSSGLSLGLAAVWSGGTMSVDRLHAGRTRITSGGTFTILNDFDLDGPDIYEGATFNVSGIVWNPATNEGDYLHFLSYMNAVSFETYGMKVTQNGAQVPITSGWNYVSGTSIGTATEGGKVKTLYTIGNVTTLAGGIAQANSSTVQQSVAADMAINGTITYKLTNDATTELTMPTSSYMNMTAVRNKAIAILAVNRPGTQTSIVNKYTSFKLRQSSTAPTT